MIFCVTRSLDEAASALLREDALAVWGVGCHPGVATAQKQFSEERFAELIQRTCFAGELGLDGARANLHRQQVTLRGALQVLKLIPGSQAFSAGATRPLLDELARTPIRGAVASLVAR
ncbi:MAG: hypothetical protein M5T61_19955 [Acidimicrobiia bacterium]|nr:hypothetical protein [Acidimicrobiia bacterium]